MPHLLKHIHVLLGTLCCSGFFFRGLVHAAEHQAAAVDAPIAPQMRESGIQFVCAPDKLAPIEREMARYLAELEIAPDLYRVVLDPAAGRLRYTLNTAPDDTNTLDFKDRHGKTLRITHDVAAKNFVPGDWPHFLNTDPATYNKTGYEGSNPIYLGRNRVFNARRDKDRVARLAQEDYERLGRSLDEGGLLLPLRTPPYLFGFEELPEMGR